MWTKRPPADPNAALRAEMAELRAAVANLGELVTALLPEIHGLRNDLAQARAAETEFRGYAAKIDAKIESIEAQLGI